MKDLLALSDTIGSFSPAVGYGADLARKLDASLTGLFVIEPWSAPTSFDVAVVSMLEAELQRTAKRARAERAAFDRLLVERGGGGGDWQVAVGPTIEAVRLASTWHDLLVVDVARRDLDSVRQAGTLATGCGLPCIVVPDGCGDRMQLDCVAVAYNGAPEAIRAIHAALPLLRIAKRVVLLCGRKPAPMLPALSDPPSFDLERLFERHGIEHERQFLEAPEESSGEEFVATAERLGAGLLVMGAYGRGRLAEMVLGGATWHALRHSRVPLFVRH